MESCTASVGIVSSSSDPLAWRVRFALSAAVLGAVTSTDALHAQVASAFESATSIPVPGVNEATIAADFDGDGDIDFAIEQAGSNRVAVLLNRGGGEFEPAETYPGAIYPHGLASADFDGDGALDLFVIDEDATAARILRNRGDGTFEPSVGYAAGYHPAVAAVADFDGDGWPDVAVSTSAAYRAPGELRILLNDNFGGLFASATIPMTSLAFLRSIDVDADGHVDLVGVSGSDLVVLRNHGDGTFEAPVRSDVGAQMAQLEFGDLDGDGRAEAILVQHLGVPAFVYVARNLGGGGFSQPEFVWPIGFQAVLTLGDVDGDTQLDLVTHDPEGGVLQEFHGRGDGTFAVPVEFALKAMSSFIRLADFDGDGDPDVVLLTVGGLVQIENRGDGRFDVEERNEPGSFVAVRSADLDGDGDPDLVASNGGQIVTLRNRGNGTFEPAQPVPGGSSPADDLLLADFDGDGDLDIASIWEFGGVTLRRNAGPGIFDPPAFVEFADPTAIAAGDVDGDGDIDLVVASLAGFFGNERQIAVLSNRGDGTFERTSRFGTEHDPANVVDLVDLDGDGALDLAYVGQSLASAYVRNDGSG